MKSLIILVLLVISCAAVRKRTISWNGAVIDRRTAPADGNIEVRFVLPSRRDGANVLHLATDQAIHPEGDGRELGLSLEAISWSEPAAASLQ